MADASEANPPPIVVTLVHGTSAPNAAWTKESSIFRAELQGKLGTNTRIEVCNWSGWNWDSSRLNGALALAEHVKRTAETGNRHFLVGHSHGGNVIRYALGEPGVIDSINGVVTLATPFVEVNVRPFREWLFSLIKMYGTLAYLASILAVIAVGVGILSLIDDSGLSAFATRLFENNAFGHYVLLPIAGGLYAIVQKLWLGPVAGAVHELALRLAVKQREIADRLDPPGIEGLPVLVCKERFDEAGLVLGSVRFSAELFFFFLRERIVTGFVLFGAVPLMTAITTILALGDDQFYSYLLAIVVSVATVPVGAILYLVAVLFVPNVLAMLGFGTDGPLKTWLVDVRFASMPAHWARPDAYDVVLPPGSWIFLGKLRHSLIHENVGAATAIADWITRTARQPKPESRVACRDHTVVARHVNAEDQYRLPYQIYFAIGFMAQALFAESALFAVGLITGIQVSPWNISHTALLGIPTLVWNCLVGGVCGLLFGIHEPRATRPIVYLAIATVFGIVVRTAIYFLDVYLRIGATPHLYRIGIPLVYFGAWGFGMAAILLWYRKGRARMA